MSDETPSPSSGEAQFHLLVETVRDYAIFLMDPEGAVVSWNPGAERIKGYTASEIIGAHFSRFYPESERAQGAPGAALARAAATGHCESEGWRVRKGGQLFWANAVITALRDPSGNLIGFAKITRDLTERKRAEEELEEKVRERTLELLRTNEALTLSEQKARAILTDRTRSEVLLGAVMDNALDAIIGINDRGTVHTYNRAAEQLFGYLAGEVIGRNVNLLMPEPYRGEHDDYIRNYLLTGQAKVIGVGRQLVARRKDGSTFPIELRIREFFLDGERHFTGVVRDMTEQRKAEEAQRLATQRLNLALDAAQMGAWTWDVATDRIYWSRNQFALYGITPHDEPMVASDFFSLVHRDDRAALQSLVGELLRQGTEYRVEFRIVRPDGDIRWLAGVGQVKRAADTGRAVEMHGLNFDITERMHTQAALQLRDRAMHAVSEGIVITDPHQPNNPIIYANPAFERLTGYSGAELIGKNCRLLQGPKTDPQTVRQVREAVAAGKACTAELLNYRKNGTAFWNQLSVAPVLDAGGRLTHFIGVQSDVTERRNLETQLRQALKMESLGRLAGGVAHDFNNLLTVIMGYAEALLDRLQGNAFATDALTEITGATERASALVMQLLLFSRKSVLAPAVLDLNLAVTNTEKLLRRVLREDVATALSLAPDLPPVKIDPGQFQQALINLAVNAQDAMPSGGRLTVGTQAVTLTEGECPDGAESRPGRYTLLEVSDTGAGMDEETKALIFEPFFTTKEVGKGTGLGLAMVYGFVKSCGGHIVVLSEPGLGTTFRLYFPTVSEGVAPPPTTARPQRSVCGDETILLVEDHDAVRALTCNLLRSFGYQVLAAPSGARAVEWARAHPEAVHLLLTDVVMPDMNGTQVAAEVRQFRPGIKVLFCSGYTNDALVSRGAADFGAAFVQKPYAPQALALKIRELLDGDH